MKPEPLCSRIRQNNAGVRKVFSYFRLSFHWKQRRPILLASLMIFGFGSLLSHRKNSAVSTSIRLTAAALVQYSRRSPCGPKGPMSQDTLENSLAVQAGHHRWRLEIRQPRHAKEEIDVEESLRVFKNDRLVRTIPAMKLGGVSLEFGKPAFKTHFPLIVIRAEPAAGHPGPITLFSIRKGELVAIGRIGGEAGGPLFRDYEGDGKKEWVFDDYDWYVYRGAHPKFLLVYKEANDGTLKMWKRLPNKKRRRLPNNLGLDRWDI
jgi:hypothetical protein